MSVIQGIVLFAVIILILFIAYYIYSRFYIKKQAIRRERSGFSYHRLPSMNDVEFGDKIPRSSRSYVSFFNKS